MSSIPPPETPARTSTTPAEPPGAPRKAANRSATDFAYFQLPTSGSRPSGLQTSQDSQQDPEQPYPIAFLGFPKLKLGSNVSLSERDRTSVARLTWVLPSANPPSLYSPTALQGTRAPTKADIELHSKKQLKETVWAPDLVRQLLQPMAAKLDRIRINSDDPSDQQTILTNTVLPRVYQSGLPPVTMSEQDTVDRVKALIMRPARALAYAILKSEGHAHDDEEELFPCITSAPQVDVCPDFLVSVLRSREERRKTKDILFKDLKMVLCGEIKTHGVLPFMDNPLYQLQSKDGIEGFACKEGCGLAIKFRWPTQVKENLPKSGRILTQIWSQMIRYKTNYLILTSEDCTTFAYRSEEYPNTLYLSPPYHGQKFPVHFLAACYLLHAVQFSERLDILPEISVPRPDSSYRTKQHEMDRTPGACNIINPGCLLMTNAGVFEPADSDDVDHLLIDDDLFDGFFEEKGPDNVTESALEEADI